ncbi:hypothetical protein NFI96_012128 [Prochilodus magdalenae]|nr:hypothetical protein NFI96_012128 [Prochilodus magdalenae]
MEWFKYVKGVIQNHLHACISEKDHGGGSVMIWGCFAASGPGRLAVINGNHEFCSLPENPEGECLAIDV